MKKVNALVLGLAVLLAVGCGGDDPEPDNSGINGPANNKCLLTKGLNKENFYDNNKKLIRQNDLFRKTYFLYEYDATGLVITTKEYRQTDSTQVGYSIYEYDANGFLRKRLSYAPSTPSSSTMVLIGTLIQDFNSTNQLIKRTYSGSLNQFSNFTYLANGEVKEEMYNYQNNNPVLYLTSYWTFDNKNSPVIFPFERKGFNGNVLLNTDIDNNNDTTVYTHSYKYNTEGYPIEETTVVSGPSNYTYTNFFEYNCQ